MWTGSSEFGGSEVLVVTLILNDRSKQNMFFMKHVAGEKESAKDLLRYRTERNNIVADTVGLRHQENLKANTVISLARINRESMAFSFASSLVAAERAGKFTRMNVNIDVEVIFPVA